MRFYIHIMFIQLFNDSFILGPIAYMYIRVCAYIYMYEQICVHTYTYTYIYIKMHRLICLYAYIYMYMYEVCAIPVSGFNLYKGRILASRAGACYAAASPVGGLIGGSDANETCIWGSN